MLSVSFDKPCYTALVFLIFSFLSQGNMALGRESTPFLCVNVTYFTQYNNFSAVKKLLQTCLF